ncbi:MULTISPECIES: hypothetical protein [Serratia]|uniref:hypothetical protein n=1 Tax=Serratia TaxID=613 RepID=UPI000810117F|nr:MULTISPECIES: hypothetical protein [Serratia]OCJ37344.1 hypothetical protein A6U95_24855 [Serratia sp. 14-2641]QXN65247.1 hypothetical protein J8M99_26155 [Serratia fonticola]
MKSKQDRWYEFCVFCFVFFISVVPMCVWFLMSKWMLASPEISDGLALIRGLLLVLCLLISLLGYISRLGIPPNKAGKVKARN